jgi:UDP-arabinose 4-epimerase
VRVLLTGGAGYIGSHTAKALALAGDEPIVLDDLRTGFRRNVRWGPLVVGDVGDRDLVLRVLRDERIEAVIHFAASAYVGESMRDPRGYFGNNVVGSLALLDAMLDAGVDRMVFSSSCATYGEPETVPIAEDQVAVPVNPYGDTKLLVERALGWFGRAYGLRWAALRYFNAAGADPDGELGEAHDPETHLVPLAIRSALEIGPPLDVLGTDYPTRDGTAVRDYVHVSDLAAGHLLALRRLVAGEPSGPLNLGTGVGRSVWDVVRAVAEVSERQVRLREAPRRSGDPPVLVADPRRATSLGWQPRFTDLRELVETAWRWHARGATNHG